MSRLLAMAFSLGYNTHLPHNSHAKRVYEDQIQDIAHHASFCDHFLRDILLSGVCEAERYAHERH